MSRVERIACGGPRKPLEPHRPAPWLIRGIAWLAASLGFLAETTALFVVAAEGRDDVVRDVTSVGVLLLVVAMLLLWIAGALRQAPVDLDPVEEE